MALRAPVGLLITLLAGCGPAIAPAPDAGAGDSGPREDTDGGPPREAPAPSCALSQAPLARPSEVSAVLVTDGSVFLGDARGLWRASGVDARFERVTSLPGGASPVHALAQRDDGAIFALLGAGRVVTSRDDGGGWEELAPIPRDGDRVRVLVTDGERIVAAIAGTSAVEPMFELDDGGWDEILAEPPVEGWGHSGFVLVAVDRGALLATPAGYRSGGLFRLERGAPRWVRVEGMDDNGYTSFARRGDVAVAASPLGISAEIDGVWRRVLARSFDAPLDHPRIVATDEGFLGVDGHAVLRSADGLAWDVEPFADARVSTPAALSERGGRVARLLGSEDPLGARFASLSADRGATWRDPSIVSQGFARVAAHGGGDARTTYVSTYDLGSYYDPSTLRGGAWSSFEWPLAYGASAVAITDTGAWACAHDGCVHRTDDGAVGGTIEMPESPYAHEPTSAFATSHGLFVGPRSYGTTCGVVQPGMIVLRDPAAGTWEDASAGMRSWTPECAGTPSIATVRSMHELDGVLFATQSEPYLAPMVQLVLRSDDGGRSWAEVREGVALTAIVRTDAGTFGLFRPGVIEALEGDVFAPAPAQPSGDPIDLVALDGWLVAATSTGLWLSDDGARSWDPLIDDARVGPIADLDVHAGILAIASRTSGLWEASGCFDE